MSTGPRIGLALGGGGGKGSAHLGVLRVLEELQLPIDMVSGTSIGGIIGAGIAAGYRATELELGFRKARLEILLVRDPLSWGLIGTSRIERLLYELLGDRTIEELPIPFGVTTVDLVTGKEVQITRGRVIDAVLATSAVPGVFPPRRTGDYLLADGGLANNLPIDLARHLGADRVIGVDLLGVADTFAVPSDDSHFSLRQLLPLAQARIAERAIVLLVRQLTAARLRETPPDLLISPDASAISMLDLRRVDDGIVAGQRAARDYAEELILLREWRKKV